VFDGGYLLLAASREDVIRFCCDQEELSALAETKMNREKQTENEQSCMARRSIAETHGGDVEEKEKRP